MNVRSMPVRCSIMYRTALMLRVYVYRAPGWSWRTADHILHLRIRYFETVQAVALSDGADGRAGEAVGCVACTPRPRLPARFASRRARRDWQDSPSFITKEEFVTPKAAVLLLLLDLLEEQRCSRT